MQSKRNPTAVHEAASPVDKSRRVFLDFARGLAKDASPLDVHRWGREYGLNRATRRRLQNLARKGKLTAFDLPPRLVANLFITQGTSNG